MVEFDIDAFLAEINKEKEEIDALSVPAPAEGAEVLPDLETDGIGLTMADMVAITAPDALPDPVSAPARRGRPKKEVPAPPEAAIAAAIATDAGAPRLGNDSGEDRLLDALARTMGALERMTRTMDRYIELAQRKDAEE